jgi:hypothetical protein
MAVNEYMTPAEYTPGVSYVSQYIPLPFEDMMKQVEKKQTAYDTGLTERKNRVFHTKGLGDQKFYGNNISFQDAAIAEELNKKYADAAQKEFEEGQQIGYWKPSTLAQEWAVDPRRIAIEQRYKSFDELSKELAKTTDDYRKQSYMDRAFAIRNDLFDKAGGVADFSGTGLGREVHSEKAVNETLSNVGKIMQEHGATEFKGVNEAGEYIFLDKTGKTVNSPQLQSAMKTIQDKTSDLGYLADAKARTNTLTKLTASNPGLLNYMTTEEIEATPEYKKLYQEEFANEQKNFEDRIMKGEIIGSTSDNRYARNVGADDANRLNLEKIKENEETILSTEEEFNYGNSDVIASKTLQDNFRTASIELSNANKILNNPNADVNTKNEARASIMRNEVVMNNLITMLPELAKQKGVDPVVAKSIETKLKSAKGRGAFMSPTGYDGFEAVLTPDEAALFKTIKPETVQMSTIGFSSPGNKGLRNDLTTYGMKNVNELMFVDQGMNNVDVLDKIESGYKLEAVSYGNKPLSTIGKGGEKISANPIKYAILDDKGKDTGEFVYAMPTVQNINKDVRDKMSLNYAKKLRSNLDNSNLLNLVTGDVYDAYNDFLTTNGKGKKLVNLDDKQINLYDKKFKFKKKTIEGVEKYDVLDSQGNSTLPKDKSGKTRYLSFDDINSHVGATVLYNLATDSNVTDNRFTQALQLKFTSPSETIGEVGNILTK